MSAISIHNGKVLKSLRKGDGIEFNRGVYSHWGIYYGEGKVIHLTGFGDQIESNPVHSFTICGVRFEKALVKITDFVQVCDGDMAYRNNEMDEKHRPKHPDSIIATALKYLDRVVPYNLFGFNCEHFATWCRYDVVHSKQIQDVTDAATVIVGAGLVAVAGVFGFRAWKNSRRSNTRMLDE